jgi:hypothetical protein
MSFSFSHFAAALKAGSRISADDVLSVRRYVWPDGSVSDDEAEVIFELNRLASDPGPEWTGFFTEAMCDYVVNARPPEGCVDEEAAEWLIDQVARGAGDAAEQAGAAELELVVRVLERALNAPASLKSWALGRIEAAVVRDGRVGEDEVGILRRILFAAGGEGALSVGRSEAEALWRIKDACVNARNCDGWKILFCQAVGSHLMAHSSCAPLDRREAARREAWVADHGSSVVGFLNRMWEGANLNVGDALGAAFPDRETTGKHDAAVDAARALVSEEQAWLDRLVEADGARDAYEEALLAFIAGESGERARAA